MKKFLSLCLTLIFLLCGLLVTGCQKEYHYYIDDSAFSLVVALNDDIESLDNLYICRVRKNEMVKTAVTTAMIKDHDSTDTVGVKNLTLSYDGREFVVPFMVKYKVDFVVEDSIINSQLVLTPDEIEYPNDPSISGVNFSAWTPVKPTEFTSNFTFTAQFALREGDIPIPTKLSATYGDKLNTLTLPSNSKGEWKFVDDLSSSVGDAGINEFEIKFIPTDSDLVAPANRKVKVDVKQKEVEFTNVSQSFVYDDTVKVPTFTLSVPGLETEYHPEYPGDAVEANKYNYEITINEKNYKGRYRGSFEIKKRQATIKIGSKTINYTQDLPKDYDVQVLDSQNAPLDATLVDKMKIELIKPTQDYAGKHTVDAKVNNKNFDVVIEKGYLFINKIYQDLTNFNPTFTNNGNVTYGNFLTSVEINNNVEPNGWWKFEDDSVQVLTANTFKTNVIYTSKDTNYLPTTKQITLNVLQRPLQIDVLQNVYTYDGNPHTLVYKVNGVLSHDEEPEVLGNIQQTNAKAEGYFTTLSIDTDKYIANTDATLTINKAKIADFSTVYASTWNDSLQLQHITTNAGYTWDKPTTDVDDIGLQSFNATFTPNDTVNYEIENGLLKVNISKAQAQIQAQSKYELTYSPNQDDYNLVGIFASHAESTLIYSYKYENESVENLKDSGNYTVNLVLPESTHYFAASKTFDVVINKVTNTDAIKTSVNATYLDTLGKSILPTNDFGTWAWIEGPDSLVGNAGVNYHTAKYTPKDIKNYHAREVEVTFNVAKKSVAVPTIAAQDYTGSKLYADIQATALYDVTLNGGDVDAGTYDVVLELKDDANYTWATSEEASVTVDFEIKKNLNNAWVDLPTVTGCTYDLGEVTSFASSIFGEVIITYANQKTPTVTTEIKPTEAGTYIITFLVEDTNNYKGLSETKTFVILPQTVAVPTIASSIYSGEDQIANITNAELYTVAENNGGNNVGVYDVVLKLNDSHNYVWSTTNNGEDLTLDFVITQADNKWETSPKITNSEDSKTIIYLDELKLTAVPKFNAERTITYVLKGSNEEPTTTQPTDAGTYTAYFTIVETANFRELTGFVDFTILPKVVECPEIDFAVYDGEDKQTALTSTGLYTVTQSIVDSEVIEQGYPVEFALIDNHNYIWTTGSHDDITKTFFIKQNPNGWKTVPNVENITYGGTVNPIALSQFGTLETVTYTIKGTNTAVSAVNAGSYTAHFNVEATNNFAGLTASVDFIIKPQVVIAPSITPVFYSGEIQKPNISAEEGIYDVVNEGGVEAGSYDVVFTLEDYGNYIWSEADVQETLIEQFVIKQNPTNDWTTTPAVTNLKNQTIVYGDEIKVVAQSTFGELNAVQYKVFGAEDSTLTTTKPTDAGDYCAIFTVNGTMNYVGNTKQVNFTIHPQEVTKPTVASKTYTGELLLADIEPVDGIYSVTQQGGDVVTSQGYPVYVELLSNNYIWNGEQADVRKITLWFKITPDESNEWTTLPKVTGFTYGDGGKVVVEAASKYGTVNILYINKDIPADTGSTTAPINAGNYTAVFSVARTVNYAGLDAVSIDFTINPSIINVPGKTTTVYNGTPQKANAIDGTYYKVTKNDEYINAGKYSIEYTILDEYYGNYIWGGNVTSKVATAEFEILKNTTNNWQTTKTPKVTNEKGESTITYGDTIVATAQAVYSHQDVEVTYFVKDSTEELATVPTTVGQYTAHFVSAGNDNYNEVTASVDFAINYQVVKKPIINSKPYTGETLLADISAREGVYKVTQAGGIEVTKQGYPVYVELLNDNYVWNGEDVTTRLITLWFKITPEESNEWTIEPEVTGFTYGDGGKVVATAQSKYGTVNIIYINKDIEGDTGSTTAPVNAGNYKAVFSVEATDSYPGLDDETIDFVINPCTITVPGKTTAVYDDTPHKANATDGTYYKVTKNDEHINAGIYSVEYTILDEYYGNYVWSGNISGKVASVEFEILQNKANNWKTTDTPKVTNEKGESTITYGDTIVATAQAIYSHQDIVVTYFVKGSNDKLTAAPTTAGEYTAYFVSAGNENYNEVTTSIEFVILPQTVECPTDAGSKVYNQGVQTTSLSNDLYNVTQTEEAIDVKPEGYSVILSLKDKTNYIWKGSNNEDKTLKFYITQATNSWLVNPKVTNTEDETTIVYLDTLKTTAQAKFGTVDIVFINKDIVGDEGSTTVPTNAGNYIAVFSVEEKANYTGLEAVSVNFKINPSTIIVPGKTTTVYNGTPQKANATDGAQYKVTINDEHIDAGKYSVEYTILDQYYGNYIWGGNVIGKVATAEFEILKNETNNWQTSNTPKVTNEKGQTTITYGDSITASAQATYSHENVVIKYFVKGSTDELETTPTTVGEYTAYFVSAGNDNYNKVTALVDFTILPQPVVIPADAGSKVYNQGAQTTSLSHDLYSVTQAEEAIDVKAEGYTVTLSLKDKTNYIWEGSNSEDKTVKFYITQADNGWEIEPSVKTDKDNATIIYLDTLKATAQATFGELNAIIYTIKGTNTVVTPTNAGEYTAHFSVTETDNYKDIAATVDFTILPQEVAVPEDAGSKSYNKGAQTTALSHDLYNVTQTEEAINVKAEGYAVTLSLKDKTNYIWEGSNSEDKSVKFYITQATNSWNTDPSVTDALNLEYGDEIVFNKGSSAFGEVQVKYLDSNKEEVAKAENAGTYYMVFYVETDEYGNYTTLNKEIQVVISPKVVDKPTITSKDYTGGPLTATVTINENTLYTVKTNDGGINVTQEGYPVVLELKDAHNYCWARGDASATTTLTFYIDQAENRWNTQPQITNTGTIYYGDTVSTTAAAQFGTPVVTYTAEGSTQELSQPTDAGTYTVTFKVAGNDNYKGLIETKTITVYPKEVDIPEFTKEFTYTGAEIAPSISDVAGDGYIATNPKHINAGTYSVNFTLESTTNYVWANTGNTQAQSVEYTIKPATDNILTTTVAEDIGWAYTSTPTAPVFKSKYGTATVWYKAKGANDAAYTTTVPRNAGSYTAKIQDTGSPNYNATDAITRDLTISKANAFITAPTYSGVHYENLVDLANDYATAPALVANYDEEVGTFTYSKWADPIISTTAAEYVTTTCSVTYTPKDPATSNYVSYTYNNIPINIKLVAYKGSTYYGTVDKALQDADSGQVIVRPDITGKVAITTPNLEIKSGVELVLPYTGDNGLVTSVGDGTGTLSGGTGLKNLSLHTKLVIKQGITVINNGIITITGEITGGQGGHGMASHTAGRYAKIVLENNAHINSYGTINCLGFIDELDLNNESSVEVKGGTVYMPFVVDDFNGGSYILACQSSNPKYMPFMQWELRNVMSKITYHYGSQLIVHANLYAKEGLFSDNSIVHHTTGNFIGTGNTFFINIAENGYITCKYNVSETDAKQNPDHEKIYNGITQIDFYGGATVNKLALEVVGYQVKTSDFYFPLTWRHSLSFNATTAGTIYTINNKYDMLPGSKVVVGKGAEVTVGSLRIYNTYTGYSANGKDCQYGYNYIEEAINLTPAELMVYGKLTATTLLAGNVQTAYLEPAEGEEYVQPIVVVNQGCTTSTTAKSVASIKDLKVFGKVIGKAVDTTNSYNLALSFTGGTEPLPYQSNVTTYKFNGTDWVSQTS